MTGHNYPDYFYADALARDEKPLGAYRSTDPETPESERKLRTALAYVSHARDLINDALAIQSTSGNRPNQPEACNPAAMREAKIAYDVACDRVRDWLVGDGGDVPLPPHGRIPKWHPEWGKTPTTVSHGLAWNGPAPPNCDGLSARDIRSPHPMSAEVIRDHDERLAGGESHL